MTDLAGTQKLLKTLRRSQDYQRRKKLSPPPAFKNTALGMVETFLAGLVDELAPAPVPAKPARAASVFAGKGLFVAWGLSNGQFTPESLAAWAVDNGYKWVALEADDFGNERYAEALRNACAGRGIRYGIWETAPDLSAGRTASFGAGFYVAEVESPSDCQALLDAPAPTVPCGLVTNFNGLDAAKAAALRAKGYWCLPEADLPGNPMATPERVVARAIQEFGWPIEQVAPVLYLNGKTFTDFGDLSRWAGWSVWLAEYVAP